VKKSLDIVIVGGGTAGWMAANLFLRKWGGKGARVTLVESPDIGIIGVGEGSTPTLKRFFHIIGIDDADWMPRCNATYKVGIRFDGWSPASGMLSYRHPFTSQPDVFLQNAFMTNCRTRRLGLDVHTQPDDFFLNGALAKARRSPLAPPSFPFEIDYGYHFDAARLGEYLAELAVSRGVDHRQARVTRVVQAESGDIASLKTETGERIDGDLFVDCTGFASLLMQKTLGVGFRSFGDNLFNDRAVALPTPVAEGEMPCETVSHALSNGWCWQIPLTRRVGNGYVYSSSFLSEDQAETELRRFVGDPDGREEARHLRMRVGQLESHWEKNCLAVGLSQGFIEPLEATALLLVQVTVELFIRHFEDAGYSDGQRATFNRKIDDRFERVRDYIVAHYKLNTRDDSDYWRANRENRQLSESLRQILDVWYRCGDLGAEIQRQNLESHFGTLSWHCLLSGYGAYPPLAPKQPGQGDLYEEKKVEAFLAGCLLNFDAHDAALSGQRKNRKAAGHRRGAA